MFCYVVLKIESLDMDIIIATLAQLVEQRFCKAKVPSSSLGGGSRNI